MINQEYIAQFNQLNLENNIKNQGQTIKNSKYDPASRRVVSAQEGITLKQFPDSDNKINKNRLRLIQQQKKKLLDKLQVVQKKVDSQEQIKKSIDYDKNIKLLMQKKRKMDQQNQRTQKQLKQIEQRQKIAFFNKKRLKQLQIQKIKNQKTQISGQISKNRIVTDFIQQQTQGLNNNDILQRALNRQIISDQTIKAFPNLSKADIRNKIANKISNEEQYKRIMQQIQSRKNAQQRPKVDVATLNNKRLQLFQKQQNLLKRKVVLRQMQAQGQQFFDKAYGMTNQEIDQILQNLGHQIDDFRHTIPPQMILENIGNIKQKAQERINELKNKKQNSNDYQYKGELKPLISRMNKQNVKISQLIIQDIIDRSVDYYQMFKGEIKDTQAKKIAYQNYANNFIKKSQQTQNSILINLIAEQIIARISKQMQKQSVEQIHRLYQLALQKTFDLIKPYLNNKSEDNMNKIIGQYNIKLKYSTGKNKLKYKNKGGQSTQDSSNVFDGTRDTKQLLNDVQLLEKQQNYFLKIKTAIKKIQCQIKQHQGIFFNRQLFLIYKNSINNLNSQFQLKLPATQQDLLCKKFINNWILYNNQNLHIINQWGRQSFNQHIGDTVSSVAGHITYSQFFPITTLLGSLCSILIGFKNGLIIKYNMNRNPVTRKQTNLSWYNPLIQNVQTGQQPNLPPQHKNLIEFTSEKISQHKKIHQYRQFINFHKKPIIFISFYTATSFITIDQNIDGALWQYDSSLKQAIQPAYKFEIKLNVKGFRYHDNPRLKIVDLKKTPQQSFKQFFEDQSMLKKQIYNNPKKQEAIYLTNLKGQKPEEIVLTKINFNNSKQRVQKIYEQIYVQKQISSKAKNAKIWNNNIFILTFRQHVIKQQLQTIKIIGWNIKNRKLRPIAYQIDIYQNQTMPQFLIIDSMLQKMQIPCVVVLNAGRILIFSLITGQLLRNVTDPTYLISADNSKLLFKYICNKDDGILIGSTKKQLYEIKFEDNNQESQIFNFQKIYQNNLLKYLE